jgi:hypothetical protein
VDVGTSIAVTQSGTWNITNISGTISLPTGAATSALQTTGNTSLASIATALASPLPVSGTFWQATQPISASSLPLPTGAATSANQTTGNTSLAAIAASTAAAEPAATGGAVSPSDSTVLSGVRALYVGGAGTVVATVGGVDLTFVAVPVGTQLQIKATKVKARHDRNPDGLARLMLLHLIAFGIISTGGTIVVPGTGDVSAPAGQTAAARRPAREAA